jgi:hypothetical protein
MNRTRISPRIIESFLNSAANAHLKGQAQFFTPASFAGLLRPILPPLKDVNVLVDLTCGNGSLLTGFIDGDWKPGAVQHLLGMDIDNAIDREARWSAALLHNFIQADLTLAYPLMVDLEWEMHGPVLLNPPWDLHWYRDRLSALAVSDCPAVAAAWAGVDARLGAGLIDATIATWMIALDRLNLKGEGVVIANHATLERLVFAPGAPFAPLAGHVWARYVIPGNPMTGDAGAQFEDQFATEVVCFARCEQGGARQFSWPPVVEHREARRGAVIRKWDVGERTVTGWRALKEECAVRFAGRPAPFNLWLTPDGRIATALSLFDQHSTRVDKAEAHSLHTLKGKRPLQVVMNRTAREHLLGLVQGSAWKVDPKLRAAVEDAVREYECARAPLYPLSEIQRIGYVDELDVIECRETLSVPGRKAPVVLLQAGQKYRITTETIEVQWKQDRPSLDGGDETLELTGHELALHVWLDQPGQKDEEESITFLDARCIERLQQTKEGRERFARTYSLQDFVKHLVIPEVPDIATLNPEAYAANLHTLDTIEALCP